MQTFSLTIVSVEKIHYAGEAKSCRIATPDGEIGLEARHEPFLAVLKENSVVRYRDVLGREHVLPVRSGMLSFRDNGCTVTVESPPAG